MSMWQFQLGLLSHLRCFISPLVSPASQHVTTMHSESHHPSHKFGEGCQSRGELLSVTVQTLLPDHHTEDRCISPHICSVCVWSVKHLWWKSGKNPVQFLSFSYFTEYLSQGCRSSRAAILQVLDVSLLQHIWFRLNGSLQKIVKFCTSLLMMHWSESGVLKHGVF